MDAPDQHRSYAPTSLTFVIVTASDSRTLERDESGEIIEQLVTEAGHRVLDRAIVADDISTIRQVAGSRLEDPETDVIILTGGTGLSPRDVTVEAITPLLEKHIEGFGELFRLLSHQQVGAAAMLSRACAGVAGSSALFALPGSPKAVRLAMESLILPEIGHLIGQLRRSPFAG